MLTNSAYLKVTKPYLLLHQSKISNAKVIRKLSRKINKCGDHSKQKMKNKMKTILLFAGILIINSAIAQTPSFQWAKTFSGDYYELCNDVAVDDSGNVYTTGYFNHSVDFDPGPGTFSMTNYFANNAFVSKLDPNGNFVWAVQLDASSGAEGNKISIDNNGDIIIAGIFHYTVDFDPSSNNFDLTSTGGSEIFIWKLSPQGNLIYAKQFAGGGNQFVQSFELDEYDNMYLAGLMDVDSVDFDPDSGTHFIHGVTAASGFICKLNPQCQLNWVKQLNGTATSLHISNTHVNINNQFVVTGYFNHSVDFDMGSGNYTLTAAGSFGDEDVFIASYDTAGNFNWVKEIGYWYKDMATDITCDYTGNIYTSGTYSSTVDFDPSNGTSSLVGPGNFTVKFDSLGNFIWVIPYGGGQLKMDDIGNLIISGIFQNTRDFDPGTGVYNLHSAGNDDDFILNISTDHNFNWVVSVAGYGTDLIQGVEAKNNAVFAVGAYQYSADFNPDTAQTYFIPVVGDFDAYIVKLGIPNIITETINIPVENSFQLFPNPASNMLFIQSTENIKSIKCINYLGQNVEMKISSNSIDISALSNGLYFLLITNEKETITRKLVVKQ